jgi:hypothetical protein
MYPGQMAMSATAMSPPGVPDLMAEGVGISSADISQIWGEKLREQREVIRSMVCLRCWMRRERGTEWA